VTKELRAFFDELKINSAARNKIYDKVNAINEEIKDMELAREKARKKIDPKYNKVEMIQKGIA